MKRTLIALIALTGILSSLSAREKIFVVERENSALAVIDHNLLYDEIKEMHNLNHAVVKFRDNDGYVITRDGYVIKFDPIHNKKLKEYKTSKSAIGFIIGANYLAVANYDNKTVEVLDRDLNPIQTIKTGSRNVGIKNYKNYLIFELMDADEIWVMKDENAGKGKPHFVLYKKFENIGKVPFDAMIHNNLYVAGLFNSPEVGLLNLDTMEYKKIPLNLGQKERILKVPHFGFWSISKNHFFVPAVGARKVFVFDHDFKPVTAIPVKGNPVFTAISPDKKWLAVSFSGKDFPYVQIVDTETFKIARTFKFPGWILHLRWSKDTPHLYFSVNTKNEVLAYRVSDPDPKKWWKHFMWPVPKPSGIFLFEAPYEPAPKLRKVSH